MNATMEADPPAWPKPLRRGEGPTKACNQDDSSSVATLRRLDATGLIGLNALRLKVAAKVQSKGK